MVLDLHDKILLLVTLVLLLLYAQPVIGQQNQIKEAAVIGSWYMNTPTKKCRILLGDHNMLTIVTSTGGFFHKEECIKTSWKLSGIKIIISDTSVKPVLGDFLLISQDKGEAILVPENEHEHTNKDGTKFHFCFRREDH